MAGRRDPSSYMLAPFCAHEGPIDSHVRRNVKAAYVRDAKLEAAEVMKECTASYQLVFPYSHEALLINLIWQDLTYQGQQNSYRTWTTNLILHNWFTHPCYANVAHVTRLFFRLQLRNSLVYVTDMMD